MAKREVWATTRMAVDAIRKKLTFSILALMLPFCAIGQQTSFNELYPILNEYVKDFPTEFRKIPEDRRYRLNEIVYYLEEQEKRKASWQLFFISTNEATVSQMAQVWAKVASYYFGYSKLRTYSGGLSPEAISTHSILAMEKAGFIVYKSDVDGMDVYRIKYSYNLTPIVAFPKKIKHIKNPFNDFMAVVVDENADLNITRIRGANKRLLLTYDDPAGYESTGIEDQYYDQSCRRIAIEMFYVFSQLRRRLKKN